MKIIQQKTISLKLKSTNKDKFDKLEQIHQDCQIVAADMLQLKKTEFVENHKIKGIGHKQYSSYSCGSAVVQQIERHIDSNLKMTLTKQKKRKCIFKYPAAIQSPIILRKDCFSFNSSKSSNHFNFWLSFRRIKFPFKITNTYQLKQLQDCSKIVGSRIIKRHKTFILQLTLEFVTESEDIFKKPIAVDMGIMDLMYCSDGSKFGNGKRIRHTKKEYQARRSRQQRRKSEIISKQSRWNTDQNHKVSRQFVDYCIENGYNHIILEKLKGTNISNRNGQKYKWSYKQLQNFIDYKAKTAGLTVEYVNPKYTSQTCSRCGTRDKRFRTNRSKFECSCGFKTNADLNAALNILSLSTFNGINVNLSSAAAFSTTVDSISTNVDKVSSSLIGLESPELTTEMHEDTTL